MSTPETVRVAASSLVFPSDGTSADAACSCLKSDQLRWRTSFPKQSLILSLNFKGKLHSLKPRLLTVRKSSVKQKKENEVLLGINFPLRKLEMTMLLSYFTLGSKLRGINQLLH